MRLRSLGIVVVAGLASQACVSRATADTSVPLMIATGASEGVYYTLGSALAHIYNTHVPGVRATAHATAASAFNLQELNEGRADVAFALGDVAYLAYTRGTRVNASQHRNLRGIAVLYMNPYHIVVRRDGPIRSLSDLTGKRAAIGVSASAPGRSAVVDLAIAAYGVDPTTVKTQLMTFEDILAGLADDSVDVGFLSVGYPDRRIAAAAAANRIRFLEVGDEAVERVRSTNPFYRPVAIPAGTYHGQSAPIMTIGVDNLLVTRQDMPEDLVYQLTAAFFESLPELMKVHPSARLIDPDEAPATPIPLHPGAARYYRERELLQ